MSAEENPQLLTPHREFVYLQDEKPPREFQEITPRSTRQMVSPYLLPFIGEVYPEDEKIPRAYQEITPRSMKHLSSKTSPLMSPRLSPNRGKSKYKDEGIPRSFQEKSPKQNISPRSSPNRTGRSLKVEKSERAIQGQNVSHKSFRNRDISPKVEQSPKVCRERSPKSRRKESNKNSPRTSTSPSKHHCGKMTGNQEDIERQDVHCYEQTNEPNKVLEPWFRMLHTVDHIGSYQPQDKSKVKPNVFKNIRDLAKLAFRIPEEEMNDDTDNYADDNTEDDYIVSEDEYLHEFAAESDSSERTNNLQTESRDFYNEIEPEEDICHIGKMTKTEQDFQVQTYSNENAIMEEEECEYADPQLSTATNEKQLSDLLEEKFYSLNNPILDAAHKILMKHSEGGYNVTGTDVYLQNTLNWVVSQFSGPSSLSQIETMVHALISWEPELAVASLVIPKHFPSKKYSPKLKLSKLKQGMETNAILDTAHDFVKDFKPQSYNPHLCNIMFKDTLTWVLSKYKGPAKFSFDKILLKTLLGLENELNNAVGLNPIPLPTVKEIQRRLPNSNPAVIIAQMMFYILSSEAGGIPNTDDLSHQMILKSLQWALQKYGSPSVKDPLTKSIVALINAEPYLEEALENRK